MTKVITIGLVILLLNVLSLVLNAALGNWVVAGLNFVTIVVVLIALENRR